MPTAVRRLATLALHDVVAESWRQATIATGGREQGEVPRVTLSNREEAQQAGPARPRCGRRQRAASDAEADEEAINHQAYRSQRDIWPGVLVPWWCTVLLLR
jgi:hypothetical protein